MSDIKGYKCAVAEDILKQMGIKNTTIAIRNNIVTFTCTDDEGISWGTTSAGGDMGMNIAAGDEIYFSDNNVVKLVIPEWDDELGCFAGAVFDYEDSLDYRCRYYNWNVELEGVDSSYPLRLIIRFRIPLANADDQNCYIENISVNRDAYDETKERPEFNVDVYTEKHIDAVVFDSLVLKSTENDMYYSITIGGKGLTYTPIQ